MKSLRGVALQVCQERVAPQLSMPARPAFARRVAQHVPSIGFWPTLRAPTAVPQAPPQRKRKLNVFIRKCKVNSIIIIVFTFALRGAVGPGWQGRRPGG